MMTTKQAATARNNIARTDTEQLVQRHYDVGGLGARIDDALRSTGVDPTRIDVDNLAPVDAFHIRGRESTTELIALLELREGVEVLDVGCGIGGSARHLALDHGCRVTGIDLTDAYCELAGELSARLGLGAQTTFRQASALDLPFEDDSFDVVWTEHAQMNIADKRRFYAEAVRVLRPGGVLAFHDVFAGHGSELSYPMPWATTDESSFLTSVPSLREILAELPVEVESWVDCTRASTVWFGNVRERFAVGAPPPLGVHLLMGASAGDKVSNAHDGLASGALVTIQAVLRKSAAR
jgi:MPBQ/MSBQ methyltransferase